MITFTVYLGYAEFSSDIQFSYQLPGSSRLRYGLVPIKSDLGLKLATHSRHLDIFVQMTVVDIALLLPFINGFHYVLLDGSIDLSKYDLPF